MKPNIPFPDEKINWFMKKLGIDLDDFKYINKYSHVFVKKDEEFSSFFHDYFCRIDETEFLLTHLDHGKALREIWKKWFASFFTRSFDYNFLLTLWKSGLRHVELNIDHRFIALSYSILRQFCQDTVKAEIPSIDQKTILIIIDKMTDFCLLIETHAFIEATSRCDMEVVRGISHQVRNPLTVIGGNIMRLMRNADNGENKSIIPEICRTIIEESRRLEKMVVDSAAYSDMFQKEAEYSIFPVDILISNAINRITQTQESTLNIKKDVSPDLMIQGDSDDLEMMFVNILEHCFDTAGQDEPDVEIFARQDNTQSPFIQIEILNRGYFQDPQEIQNAFVPFYSSRPDKTGFGLSIARLAARKSLGDIYIETLPETGTKYVVKLPLPVSREQ